MYSDLFLKVPPNRIELFLLGCKPSALPLHHGGVEVIVRIELTCLGYKASIMSHYMRRPERA